LPSTCQIAKPEQSLAGDKQPEPDKLINGAAGELAQRGNLVGRIGPMQTVRDRFPDPFEKAALAYHWNAVAACSAQLVGWSTIIQ
jgi:Rap1a immunity proteins